MKIEFRTPKAKDGSIKYQFKTADGHLVEALFFSYHDGLKVLCLSTQVGCDMKCCFCGTGQMKKKRNLTQDEIVKQAQLIVQDAFPKEKPDTITLAGQGEPLDNYEASIGALLEFRKLYGDIRLSLSTVGLVKGIEKLIEEKRSFGLYLSLHSSEDLIRQKMIPAAKSVAIIDLINLVNRYAKINPTGTVRISYLLLKGITDSDDQLEKLIQLVKGKNFVVQLRIWNPVTGINLQSCTEDNANKWIDRLQKEGIQAGLRPSVGQEHNSACGQMKNVDSQHKIIPIDSFAEINSYSDHFNQKTLILVDVDSTLIVPADPLLHPKAFSTYKHVVRELYDAISPTVKHFVNHSIAAQPAMIIEEICVQWIQKMQDQNIPILAMTAAKKGRFDQTNRNFHEIRYAQLKKVGIDFSNHSQGDVDFFSLIPTYEDYPALIDGIIYACGYNNTKGSVLKELMKNYPHIDRVVLIDDKKKHLESIANVLSELFPRISFIGFHYHAANFLIPEILKSEEQFRENLLSLIHKTKEINWI